MPKSKKNNRKTPGARLIKRRKPGDLDTLRLKLWRAVDSAERLLYSDGIAFAEQVRAVHALVQAAAAYAKLLEKTELQDQIDTLKEELERLRDRVDLRRAA